MARARAKGTRQSVMNKRRKGFLAIFFPWLRRFGIGLAVFSGVLWLGAWLVMSGTLSRGKDWADNKIVMATADMGFIVKNILVEGREYTDPQTLLAIVNIQKGDPLFSFEPKAAQDLISQIGWVDHVQVERRFPDTIYIGLTERQPLVLWQHDQKLQLLDQNGKVIATDGIERFKDLKIVLGPDAPEFAVELMDNLKGEPDLAKRVVAARRLGERRWDLVLDNELVVKLPEQDMALALSRLADEERKSGVLQRDIESIDMREEGRMVVSTRPGAVQEYKASLTTDAKKGNNI